MPGTLLPPPAPAHSRSLERPPADYPLRLFVAGDEPNSRLARHNLQALGASDPGGHPPLEVIDVLQDCAAALGAGIVLVPALQVLGPRPLTLYGTLGDSAALQAALAPGSAGALPGGTPPENAEAILLGLARREADALIGPNGVMILRSQEVYDSEVRFRTMADAAPIMIWVCTPDQQRSWVNQRLLFFTGRSLAEECGRGWSAGVHEDDRTECLEAFSEAFARRQAFELEYRLRNADGEYRWIADSGVPHYGPAGEFLGYVGSCVDHTMHRAAQRHLAEARDVAEQANRAKSGFLAAASHDLRQPLSALSLYVEVLKSRPAADNTELIANIADCVDDLSGLLTDLLDVSKLEAGVVTPRPSDFSINELLATLVSVHGSKARQKGLSLRWRSTRAVGFTDQLLLRRTLGNLVANAIRYTEQGGVLLDCRRRQGKLWIEVWDTGIGIPDDKRQIIFEEFIQLDEARNRGSGLGLAIVAKTARLLGLQVRLCSRPGRGSLFAIEVPPGRAAPSRGLAAQRPATRHIRIGLVEDNPDVLRALVFALEDAGYEVVGEPSAPELIKALGERRLDVVISDYRLGGATNGFAAIKALRALFGESLPALLITGDTDPVLIRSMATQGIAVHFKPLQMDALQAFLWEATERRAS